jgi:beta-galactosidase
MQHQPEKPLARWISAGFDRTTDELLNLEAKDNSITLVHKITAAAGELIFTRKFTASGQGFTVSQHYAVPESFPPLPRVGVISSLKNMEKFEYFGRGPWENYVDRNRASMVGRYVSTATENSRINYCVPQENGSRTDTRKVILYGEKCCLKISGMPRFEFGVSKYTAGELFAAKHPCELTAHRETFLTLDLKQQGMGSAACGPHLPEKYTIPDKEYIFEFSFSVTPAMP